MNALAVHICTFLQILSSTFLCVRVRLFVCMYKCVQQVRSFPFSCSTLPLIIFLSMCISYYLSVGLSIFLSIHLSFCLSVFSFNSPHVFHLTFLPQSLSTLSSHRLSYYKFFPFYFNILHFIFIFSILFSFFLFHSFLFYS